MGLDLDSVGKKVMNKQEILEMHLMGHAKQLIVVVEGGKKVEREDLRFTLKYLV